MHSSTENHAVLVLGNPTDPRLAMLAALPDATSITVGACREAFAQAAPDATVILNWALGGRELLRQVLAMAPRVRWIHARAAGLDTLLFPELVASPAILTNGRGVFSEPLGEFAMAAALFFAKDLRRMVASQQAGRWDPFEVTEIAGQTMGIIGYGDIGRACARRARALGMQVLALRRHPAAEPDAEVLGPEGKMELLARSDYVVLSAPLTPETDGIIGAAELAAMKQTAVLINIGRGPLVREPDLIEALRARRIRGAALDVFNREPLTPGHPFYAFDNLLLSPHCADHTPGWLARAMQLFLDNFELFRHGRPLRNVVDKQRGY